MCFKIYRYYLEDMILCSKYVDLYGLELNFDKKNLRFYVVFLVLNELNEFICVYIMIILCFGYIMCSF